MTLPVIDMESDSNRNVGRLDQSGELGFAPGPGKLIQRPLCNRPGAGLAYAMVARSRAREGRGVNTVPKTEFRPEMEIRPEMDIPAEIPITL